MNINSLQSYIQTERPCFSHDPSESDVKRGVFRKEEIESQIEDNEFKNEVEDYLLGIESILENTCEKYIKHKHVPKWFKGMKKTWRRQFLKRNPTYNYWRGRIIFELESNGNRTITGLN